MTSWILHVVICLYAYECNHQTSAVCFSTGGPEQLAFQAASVRASQAERISLADVCMITHMAHGTAAILAVAAPCRILYLNPQSR